MNDQFMLALTGWRENRGGGQQGLQSVMNVIVNRATQRNTSPYAEIVRPWQFSSITAAGDPELNLWPGAADPEWQLAQKLASLAEQGQLPDITDGATFYYALTIPPPAWAAAMTETAIIQGQRFMK